MQEMLKNLPSTLLDRIKSARDASSSERYLVALDIGTENVKALIGRIGDASIDIVGVGRSHQGLSDMQAGAVADIAAVTANCNSALAQAEEQAGVSARAVVVGIAGELVKGTTTSVRVTRKDGKKPLDIEEIERVITLVQERANEKAKKQILTELGRKDIDIQLVNSALIRMEIDGYSVTNPVGFQGKEIMVQLYTAFAPLIHIGALEQVVNQLDMDLIAVAAEPFAVARSVVGDEESSMNAILMDVGGGTTDIAVLTEGGVQGTEMFGIGGRAFTKSIERDVDVEFDQAETMKLALAKDALGDKDKTPVSKALLKTVKVWRSGVELALDEFTRLDQLPHKILLCGGGSSLDMLVKELEQSNWYEELPFTKKPTVQHISPETVVGIHDTTELVEDHTYTTAMGLLRVGMDTMEQNGVDTGSNSIMQRINRMLQV